MNLALIDKESREESNEKGWILTTTENFIT